MSTLYKLFFISFCVFFSINSTAETGYVSDGVYTYMHKGPSAQFKIMGSISAGKKIEILEKSKDGKYTKILDSRGRRGWIMTKFASTKPSLKQRYSTLEKKYETQVKLNEELSANSNADETNALNAQIEQLNLDLVQANEEAAIAKAQFEKEYLLAKEKLDNELSLVQSKLKSEEVDIQIKWLTHGGILVLASFLIGIIVSSLTSKRRGSKKSSW